MASVAVELGVTPETTYSIAGKQVKFDTKADIEPYLKELAQVTPLKKIDFSGNTIGVEATEALATAILSKCDELVEADLSDIYTGRLNTEIPQSLEFLLPALLKCDNLKLVNLSDNALGLQAIDPIEEYLGKAVSLEHLILSNNGMGPFAGATIGKSLYRLAVAKSKDSKAPQSLKTFICGRNRLENGSIDYLSIGLRAHKNLEVVRLYQNGIRPTGISKLVSSGLSNNKNLKIVDLQDNTLTRKASVVLADALSSWIHLEELNLNDCLMNPLGSLALVKSLECAKNLKALKLQYNELDARSLEILVSTTKSHLNVLKSLELNGNRFEEDSELVDQLNEIFEERGFGELDELDDLEELDSDEEEEDEDESEEEAEEEEVELDQLEKELAEAENLVISEQTGVQEKDATVDALTKELEEAHIK